MPVNTRGASAARIPRAPLRPGIERPNHDRTPPQSDERDEGSRPSSEQLGPEQRLANQQLANQQLANQQLANQQLANQQLANQQLANQQLANQRVANQRLAVYIPFENGGRSGLDARSTWTVGLASSVVMGAHEVAAREGGQPSRVERIDPHGLGAAHVGHRGWALSTSCGRVMRVT
jgi:hypothetical protein